MGWDLRRGARSHPCMGCLYISSSTQDSSTHDNTISRGITIMAGFCGCSNKAPTHRFVVCDNGNQRNLRDAASRAVRSLEQDLGVNPTLICVTYTEGVSLWRAEFGGDHMPHSLNHTCQWISPQDIPQRKHWYRPHFDVLTHFGVWSLELGSQ